MVHCSQLIESVTSERNKPQLNLRSCPAIALLSIALSIGATAVVFPAVKSVPLDPLPLQIRSTMISVICMVSRTLAVTASGTQCEIKCGKPLPDAAARFLGGRRGHVCGHYTNAGPPPGNGRAHRVPERIRGVLAVSVTHTESGLPQPSRFEEARPGGAVSHTAPSPVRESRLCRHR